MSSIRDYFKPRASSDVQSSSQPIEQGGVFRRSEKTMVKPKSSPPEVDEIGDDLMEEAVKIADSLGSDGVTHPPTPGKRKAGYSSYMKRKAAGPSAPGSKEIPSGSPNCLEGLTFVFTGELSCISREDISDLIKTLGGRVTISPSRKTDYVVVGDLAGESKLAKVRDLGLKMIKEDELFALIRDRSSKSVPSPKSAASLTNSKTDSSPSKRVKVDPAPSGRSKIPSPSKTSKLPSPSKTSKRLSPIKASASPSRKPSTVLTPHANPNDIWTIKYAPKSESDLIGNHSIYEKLISWLSQESAGREHKAALLSGPPGIGKTTMAHLAAHSCDYQILEFNASDCRSKKILQNSVKEIINNSTINPQFYSINGSQKKLEGHFKKQVLIMDEVDGMSSGDRGGMAELIQLIKKSRVPIICCCNDRSSPKVRSLANYCLDLRLRRPDHRQIQNRINEICNHEGLRLQPNVVEELVTSTHGDIRQLLNCLSTFKLSGSTNLTFEQSKNIAKKDLEEGPFDVIYKLLGGQYDKLTMAQRLDAYFVDSSLVPLMVHENYLRAKPNAARPLLTDPAPSFIKLAAAAADAISRSDKVDSLIRGSNQEWSLAPLHGFYSSVLPAYYVHGSLSGQIAFPGWFGLNSKSAKNQRLLRELASHTFTTLRSTSSQLRLFYADWLICRIVSNVHNTDAAIAFMDDMHLCREDVESLLEVTMQQDEWSKIPSAVKSAFTRKYNAGAHKLPYAVGASQGKSIRVADMDAGVEVEGDVDDENDSNDDEDDSITNDKMIKEKKPGKVATKKK